MGMGDKTKKACSSTKEIRLKHHCQPKMIVEINKHLSDLQRQTIQCSPFNCLLSLTEGFKLCSPLLLELVKRWDETRWGFRIQDRLVKFTPIHVCLALGLRVVGKAVEVSENIDCITKSLFDEELVTIDKLFEVISGNYIRCDSDVDNFARLYILLGFSEFFFPVTNRGRPIDGSYMRYLDNLSEIGTYQWGTVVYEYLVGRLNKAASRISSGNNAYELHLGGCAAVLQIWALEHITSIRPQGHSPIANWPRILCMPLLQIKNKQISKLFRTSQFFTEVTLSDDELCFDILREGFESLKGGTNEGSSTSQKMKHLISEQKRLNEENRQLKERFVLLEEKLTRLQVEHNSLIDRFNKHVPSNMDDADHALIVPLTPLLVQSMEVQPNEAVNTTAAMCKDTDSGGKVRQISNMYRRMKVNPRKRFKSSKLDS